MVNLLKRNRNFLIWSHLKVDKNGKLKWIIFDDNNFLYECIHKCNCLQANCCSIKMLLHYTISFLSRWRLVTWSLSLASWSTRSRSRCCPWRPSWVWLWAAGCCCWSSSGCWSPTSGAPPRRRGTTRRCRYSSTPSRATSGTSANKVSRNKRCWLLPKTLKNWIWFSDLFITHNYVIWLSLLFLPYLGNLWLDSCKATNFNQIILQTLLYYQINSMCLRPRVYFNCRWVTHSRSQCQLHLVNFLLNILKVMAIK